MIAYDGCMNKVAFSLGMTAILALLALNFAVCWCACEIRACNATLEKVNKNMNSLYFSLSPLDDLRDIRDDLDAGRTFYVKLETEE